MTRPERPTDGLARPRDESRQGPLEDRPIFGGLLTLSLSTSNRQYLRFRNSRIRQFQVGFNKRAVAPLSRRSVPQTEEFEGRWSP
jgi:hypothetical protein